MTFSWKNYLRNFFVIRLLNRFLFFTSRREIIFCPSYETQNCLPECLLKGLEKLEHPLRMKWSKTAHFKLRKMIAGHALANKAKFEEFASYDKDDTRLLTRRTKNLRISVIYMISDSII